MRFLRKRFICRFLSILLLFVFIQSIFLPYYAFALTSGPHQPEYTSYEDAGATDMVNLTTGDFGFNLPLLEVPGPEGNFAMPLSYHAGIGLEQESSWCGLGFNLNAGSLLRNINQYPDDASGEANYVTVQNLTPITGYNRVYNQPFKDDWNSQTGYHGNLNLLDVVEVDFGAGGTNVGVMGVHVGDHGVSFNGVQFVSASMTVLSYGATSEGATLAQLAKQVAIDVAVNSAVSFVSPVNTPASMGVSRYSSSTGKTSISYDGRASLIFSVQFWGGNWFPIFSRKKSWKMWLDQTRAENMYGVLYLGNAQTSPQHNPILINNVSTPYNASYSWTNQSGFTGNGGGASDINFTMDNSASTYKAQSPATVLATDNYIVNGPGISGSIKPYRLETGSVAMPRDMATYYTKNYLLPYLNYKVPFIYEGSMFNKYFYHVGNNSSNPSLFNYGLESPFSQGITSPYDYVLTDNIFNPSQRVQADFDVARKIPQGNNINWFSNSELSNYTAPAGFMDFLSNYVPAGQANSDRDNFRGTFSTTKYPITFKTSVTSFATKIPVNDPAFLAQMSVGDPIRATITTSSGTSDYNVSVAAKDNSSITISSAIGTPNGVAADIILEYKITPNLTYGIGGYSINGPDGSTYHYALPVLAYDEKTESIDITDATKRSMITRYMPYASTWLLTSITGSDYVDRNGNQLVDDGDWGYWVKMNYGRHASATDYSWRIPFTGEMPSSNNSYKSYEKGKKQLYYLNSIETRSHIALFMKSNRGDAGSADTYGQVFPLKLDEICLLKKENYKNLVSSFGTGYDYTNKITPICLTSQYTGASVRDYVNKNCLKRILFNYATDSRQLCKGIPNVNTAINPLSGKLTLIGISIKGRNDVKVVPDYKFEYANNPVYNSNYWDGWGMYNPFGNSSPSTHTTLDPQQTYGSAWSLTKVVTPLSGEMSIDYERDTYSSISGEATNMKIPFGGIFDGVSHGQDNYVDVNGNFDLKAGDYVVVNGTATVYCPNTNIPVSFNTTCKILSVVGQRVTFTSNYTDMGCTNSTTISYQLNGTLDPVVREKKGGGIRVASIRMRDENGKENKIRYLYKDDSGNSSGVVSQEPDYIRNVTYPFYDYLKYPQTPVMYGKVTVLSGPLSNDVDYYTKQVFEFETPHKSMIKFQSLDQGSTTSYSKKLFTIQDRTSKIGKLKSIKVYDKAGNLVNDSKLVYTDQITSDDLSTNQGVFSESTLLTDNSTESGVGWGVKMHRTSALTYPYALKKVINSKDGVSSTSENLTWDLITGAVTQKLDKSSLGIYVKTVTKPAYKIYPEMGSKAISMSNKNMLLQNASVYTYRSDPMGNQLGIISGVAQTWNKDWGNYKSYDAATLTYKEEGSAANQNYAVWRKGPAYVWKGSYSKLNTADGTQVFSSPTDEFNFTGSNSQWQYTSEIKRFDHYGMPLEGVDMNGISSVVKMGYDDRKIIASASNASYNEIAYSGAEDKIAAQPFFGGEVGIGNSANAIISSPVHTGYNALSVADGNYGFKFNSPDISLSKTYRASAWTNSANGKLYYKLSNGTEVVPSSQTISAAVAIPNMGNWYRIDMVTPLNPSLQIVEVGVKAVGGTVVFDDFRFQPSDAIMTCSVYPPLGYQFAVSAPTYSPVYSYVLDNDNIFTKYEANEQGDLVKVYQESIKYGVIQVKENKKDYRRLHINP
ncbi:MAG TPA: hypothetical protein VIM65_12840 [Cyclobacteriaceae bacterium]